MTPFIDEVRCIGCGTCAHFCADAFTLDEDKGRARAVDVDARLEQQVRRAAHFCPTACITIQ